MEATAVLLVRCRRKERHKMLGALPSSDKPHRGLMKPNEYDRPPEARRQIKTDSILIYMAVRTD